MEALFGKSLDVKFAAVIEAKLDRALLKTCRLKITDLKGIEFIVASFGVDLAPDPTGFDIDTKKGKELEKLKARRKALDARKKALKTLPQSK